MKKAYTSPDTKIIIITPLCLLSGSDKEINKDGDYDDENMIIL